MHVVRSLVALGRQQRNQVGDVTAIYSTGWAQRVLNPFPLASSGGVWGEMVVPGPIRLLSFYCDVDVSTTNDGANFWTVDLVELVAGTVLASFDTSGIAANTWTRFTDTTVTQPSATPLGVYIRPTATLNPGAIYIAPGIAFLRT